MVRGESGRVYREGGREREREEGEERGRGRGVVFDSFDSNSLKFLG